VSPLCLAFARTAALSAGRNPCSASASAGAAAFLLPAWSRGIIAVVFGDGGGSLFPEGTGQHFNKRRHLGDAADYLLHFGHSRDDAVYAAHTVDDAFDVIQAVAEIEAAAFGWFGSFRDVLIWKDERLAYGRWLYRNARYTGRKLGFVVWDRVIP
jgi:hypothetical protein